MGLPGRELRVEDIPRREAVVALRLEQVEREAAAGLVGPNDQRGRGYLVFAPLELAGHCRLAMPLKRLSGVLDLVDDERIDDPARWSGDPLHDDAMSPQHTFDRIEYRSGR